MNIWILILSLFSILGFILSGVFAIKKEQFNKLFALLLFMFAFNVFFNILYWTQQKTKLYAFFHMSYLIPLSLYGGLFFLYLKSITTRKKLSKLDMFHFLPFIVTMVLYSGFYFLKPAIKYQVFIERRALDYVIHIPYFGTLLVAVLLAYSVLVYTRFRNAFKEDREMNLWIRYTMLAFIGFALSFVLYEILVFTQILKIEHDYIITILSVVFIGVVAYLVYLYPVVFNGKPINKVLPFVKYKKTGLRKEDAIQLKERLLEIMEKDRPYLNADLRLIHLSEMLAVPRHHTSQVINEYFHTNFFDFINQYRVSESEKLLKTDVQDQTMEGIAYQSGFNNRVSFYKAFKKFNGVTPTHYKEQYS